MTRTGFRTSCRGKTVFVSQHARDRIEQRLNPVLAYSIIQRLEDNPGYQYTVVFVLHRDLNVVCDDGSNGDTLLAVAVEGTVETVYFRRGEQTYDPRHFGAQRVIDLTGRGFVERRHADGASFTASPATHDEYNEFVDEADAEDDGVERWPEFNEFGGEA